MFQMIEILLNYKIVLISHREKLMIILKILCSDFMVELHPCQLT